MPLGAPSQRPSVLFGWCPSPPPLRRTSPAPLLPQPASYPRSPELLSPAQRPSCGLLEMNRRFKQAAKGFVGKMVPSKERLFQGSTSTGAKREALLRCVDPNLEGVPIALQRTEGENDEEEAGAEHEDEVEEAGVGHEDDDEAGADEGLMGGDGSEEVVQRRGTRKSHYIHPPIPAPADRIPIRPIRDSQWEDVTWDGTGHRRTPNVLLGNIIHVNNPGVVQKNGESIPMTTWKHFALAPHVTYGSVQGPVKHKLWNYFRVDPSQQDHADRVHDQAAKKICKDLFSNLWL
ncbi:hypothetical protein U9M48_002087 [Paspalum notatum var. saurae]|uniref:Uncharacterized protein n=1 Tax=Paspalum notatum var. saurae TaxID=547442 RepID=A0AAQ3PN93_PASNO